MRNNKDFSWPTLQYESDEDLSPHQMQNAESAVTDTPPTSMVHPEKELEFEEETEPLKPAAPSPNPPARLDAIRL